MNDGQYGGGPTTKFPEYTVPSAVQAHK